MDFVAITVSGAMNLSLVRIARACFLFAILAWDGESCVLWKALRSFGIRSIE